jgi:C4-dicarboxylate-specific signal transduction histidine kinase
LLQVLLNLVKNSERALEPVPGYRESGPERAMTLQARTEGDRVFVTVSDTGPGVARPEVLFKPFQQQAHATGLGLYLSRALMRSFSGDLRYIPGDHGARFVVDLAIAKGEPRL